MILLLEKRRRRNICYLKKFFISIILRETMKAGRKSLFN